jgi:hypothetical protein
MSEIIQRFQTVKSLIGDASLPKADRLRQALHVLTQFVPKGVGDDLVEPWHTDARQIAETIDRLGNLHDQGEEALDPDLAGEREDLASTNDAELQSAIEMLDSTASRFIDAALRLIVAKLSPGVGRLPEDAIREAREHRDLMVPRLIEVIQNAVTAVREGKPPEGNAHFFAAFLLTEFKAAEAFPLLLEAFSLPDQLPDELFGDAVYELPARMLAIFQGDRLEEIDALIDDLGLDDSFRWQAAASLIYLVSDGRLSRDEAVERLRRHLRLAIDRGDEKGADALVSELDLYAPAEALDDIREAYQRGLVDTSLIWLEDIERSIAEGEARFEEELERRRPVEIDTIEELRHWASFEERPAVTSTRRPTEPPFRPDSTFAPHVGRVGEPSQSGPAPIVSRGERVGRNDPCPCGSGKKFKKCCGAHH